MPRDEKVVFTFYSFKGGVGRSMALANVAEYLCARGARVIMIDWDLEAPGLENYFFSKDERSDVRMQLGLIDLLDEYKRRFKRVNALDARSSISLFPEVTRQLSPLSTYLYPIHALQSQGGGLWLLPAGWRISTPETEASKPGAPQDDRFTKYASAVQGFDWSDFYASYEGESFFDWLREQLFSASVIAASDGHGADVVLIDSRTGVTEVGGIATRQLADVVVCFSAPNYQNLHGTTDMARSFQHPDVMNARNQRRLDVLMIPARVDQTAETDLKDEFRKQFEAIALSPPLFERLSIRSWDLVVPYLAKYSYAESLAVKNESSDLVSDALRKLATHLVLLAGTESRLYELFGADLIAISSAAVPRVFLLPAGSGSGLPTLLKRLASEIEVCTNLDLARSLLVYFDSPGAVLGADARAKIRLARQKGICVYLAASGDFPLDPATLPTTLRTATIYSTEANWAELVRVLRRPCLAPRVPFVSLSLPAHFTGRESEIEACVQGLLSRRDGQNLSVVSLYGQIGMGLTSLALRVCQDERVLDAFDDGILWGRLGKNTNPLSLITDLFTNLTGEHFEFGSFQHGSAALAERLAGRACLLVLDEVEEPREAELFAGLPCARLIVSARTDVAPDALRKIYVGPLRAEEAIDVLLGREILSYSAALQPLSRLAAQLGYWPSALAVARSAIAEAVAGGESPEKAVTSLSRTLATTGPAALGSVAADLQARAKVRLDATLAQLSSSDLGFYERLAQWDTAEPHTISEIQAFARVGLQELEALLKRLEQLTLIVRWPSPEYAFVDVLAAGYFKARREAASSAPKEVAGGFRAFIIRPFGTRAGVNFDAVEQQLIAPALQMVGAGGRTTGEILEAGNIRIDMFQQLLVADLVVADITINNPNVFYELGIRHALREGRTVLIRAGEVRPTRIFDPDSASVPFDLKTDRYCQYDPEDPATSLQRLAEVLRVTATSRRQDSPVFLSLPNFKPPTLETFAPVPLDFGEEIARAEKNKDAGKLTLLSLETVGFPWEFTGLRAAGRALLLVKAYGGAKIAWERLREIDEHDLEANVMLGNIYQRVGDLASSDQALERALRAVTSPADLAEIYGQLGRNKKDRWASSWSDDGNSEDRARKALDSPLLSEAYQQYLQAYRLDLDSYYPGLNALALAVVILDLASRFPDVWSAPFADPGEGDVRLAEIKRKREQISQALQLRFDDAYGTTQDVSQDAWLLSSAGDLNLLMHPPNPRRASYLYKRAAATLAGDFVLDSVRKQLSMLMQLGVLEKQIKEVLNSFPSSEFAPVATRRIERALVFTGHRIDSVNRSMPRFPAEKENVAREAIRAAISQEKALSAGPIIGIAGGANGGDTLFLESCEELDIETKMLLALPENQFVEASVDNEDKRWLRRFHTQLEKHPQVPILAESPELPRWLQHKRGYDIWQRNNLWILSEAVSLAPRNLTLIAFWDGEGGDGPGGTEYMISFARQHGARIVHINTKQLFDVT
jgi:tetratricopeptide (TPR) repeat protein